MVTARRAVMTGCATSKKPNCPVSAASIMETSAQFPLDTPAGVMIGIPHIPAITTGQRIVWKKNGHHRGYVRK